MTVAVSVPASSLPISARDARGRTVSLAVKPERIVSLAPAVTEILFAVGAGRRVVGVTAYCDYPAAAKTLPRIGNFRASVEKVIARKPDVVIASASANSQAIPQIERLGIPLFAIDTKTVEQVLDAIRGIGRVTGSEIGARKLLETMRSRLNTIKAKVSTARTRPRTLIVVDVNGPWVAGRDNYMDDLVSMAGGVNVARGAGVGWLRYSSERAVMGRPDVIIVTDRDAGRVASFPGWSRLPAVSKGRIHGKVPIALVRPGPRLPAALEFVAQKLHPTLFPAVR